MRLRSMPCAHSTATSRYVRERGAAPGMDAATGAGADSSMAGLASMRNTMDSRSTCARERERDASGALRGEGRRRIRRNGANLGTPSRASAHLERQLILVLLLVILNVTPRARHDAGKTETNAPGRRERSRF